MNDSFQLEVACHAPITERMINYVAAKAASVIQCNSPTATIIARAMTPPLTPNSTSYNNNSASSYRPKSETQIPSLPIFISNIVERSQAQTPTLLSTLVYLDRLQRHLPKSARGMRCTCHRVFLAALILAAKYTNDSSPKNKHWASFSSAFSLVEVNLMEQQLLYLLNFDLKIHESELIKQSRPFFHQGIGHPSPMVKQPTEPFTSFDESIRPNRTHPEPESHHRSIRSISSFQDHAHLLGSPCDRGIRFHRILEVPKGHNHHAAFYPSPSHSDTVQSAHGGSRRSSISDSIHFGAFDASSDGEGSLPMTYYHEYPNVVIDDGIDAPDTLQTLSSYHVQPHLWSRGAIY